MDFDFSDDQEQLRDAVRRWVDKGYGFERRRALAISPEGHCPQTWAQLAEIALAEGAEENGWHAVQWQGANGKSFTLYPHEFARDAIDGDASAVSPDGRFVMLYRLRQSGRQVTPPTLRCDMVAMDTGCVMATRLARPTIR